MGLVLRRKRGEALRIGDALVTVADVRRSGVRLVIDAPRDVVVDRVDDPAGRGRNGGRRDGSGITDGTEARGAGA